jgi:very-short-patch-repair endonuclease
MGDFYFLLYLYIFICRDLLITNKNILLMKIEIECLNCQEKFMTDYKHRDKKFCNRKCYFDHAKKNNIIGKKKDPNVREERICVQCGGSFEERKKHKRNLCSDECRNIWNMNPVNIENRIKKSKDSLSKKYGEDSIFKLEEFKKNNKINFKKKYGVGSPMHVPEFVEKLKNNIRSKHLNNLLPKLKFFNIELVDEYIKNKDGNTSQYYNFKCCNCENVFTSTVLGSGKIPICRKCFPINKNSKLEQILKDYLNDINIKHINGDRKILNGKEIDIYIPEYNLGIEINGNYFHSEINGDKSKNYHINKTQDCYQKDVTLIQIYEDEILLKKDIVLSKIGSKLNQSVKLFARKCEIKELNKKESSEFLKKNHLQGDSIDKIRLGLYHNNELVSVMTFGKKRKSLGNRLNKNDEYELIRFCNKINLTIVGGFSKLLKNFIKNFNPSKIETYADIRWSGLNPTNTVYGKNNFEFVRKTPPNYWYLNTDKFLNRYHRFSFRKDVLVKEGYDKKMTEWEIMKLKGYDRIWDCGSLKFELSL